MSYEKTKGKNPGNNRVITVSEEVLRRVIEEEVRSFLSTAWFSCGEAALQDRQGHRKCVSRLIDRSATSAGERS